MIFRSVELGWAEGTNFFPSRIIERLDDSKYSHVYWKFTMENGLRFLYESHLNGGVQITPYEHLERAMFQNRVASICEIPVTCNADALWNECLKYHGDPYDVGQIIRYYIWIKWFHRKGEVYRPYVNDKFTCNEFIVTTGKPIIIAMHALDYSYTPEGLFRYFMGHASRNPATLVAAKAQKRPHFQIQLA